MCDLETRNLVNKEALVHWGAVAKKTNIPSLINKILNIGACFENQNLRLSSITMIFFAHLSLLVKLIILRTVVLSFCFPSHFSVLNNIIYCKLVYLIFVVEFKKK